MSVWRLVFQEISHRKINFALGVFSVSVAVACLVGALIFLKIDDHRTESILAQKQKEIEKAGADLEDSMRKITKGLGFNVIILPEDQDLNEMHVKGTLSKSMPEEYAHRLANSKIVTINHLLPTVVKKITWPEMNLPILLYGTRGEVPMMHSDPKKPLLDSVPQGTMILGFQVSEKLHLKEGDAVTLLGRNFTVAKRHQERGTIDDSTVWINLAEAQEMLGMKNLINAIQALECQCVGDRITEIRKEIAGILPGTQVIERGPPALARAEARNKVKEAAESALTLETARRAEIRNQRQEFASRLVPLALLGCTVWIGLLAYGNVRGRFQEIAVLRAIGFRTRQIFSLFVSKALLIGLSGGLIGYCAGFLAGVGSLDSSLIDSSLGQWFDPGVLILAAITAPLLSVFGSWIPAMAAVRSDPAVVLQEE